VYNKRMFLVFAFIRVDFVCDLMACRLVLASGVLTHIDPAEWEER
jgi:hypothetical protein